MARRRKVKRIEYFPNNSNIVHLCIKTPNTYSSQLFAVTASKSLYINQYPNKDILWRTCINNPSRTIHIAIDVLGTVVRSDGTATQQITCHWVYAREL